MATATLLRPGDLLGGFRVEDLIGVGGMATVYRAEQVSLGRAVALKVLSRQLTGDEVFRERFRREGMHAASLEHPNIVPVYDSGEQDGLLYLAMRLVEGASLAERLTSPGVTAEQAIEILGPIASALDCAHAAGLVHRDVKPQNILITDQGHPYLADFGVAKSSNAAGLTATGGFVGSVNYASPEQIRGLSLTPASDVYALTAVLYHCLSGDVPYPGESEAGVMHAHLSAPPPSLPALEGADGECQAVFARGMAKDPGERYASAGELLAAASLCVDGMPAGASAAVPAFPRRGQSERDQVVEEAERAPVAGEALAYPLSAGDLTAADRRRKAAPVEPKAAPSRLSRLSLRRPPRPRLPRWRSPSRRLLAIVVGAIALVVLGALVLGGLGGGEAAASSARSGPVELSYESPWRLAAKPSGAPTYGLGFQAPIVLNSDRAKLIAGVLANGAPVPGALPPKLSARLDRGPSRVSTRLGGAEAIRYTSTVGGGATALTMFVVPTDHGDIGLLCEEAAAASGGSACAATAGTLVVHGVRPVPAGADPALASDLAAALGPVAARERRSGLAASRGPADRAKALREVAKIDARAVSQLSGSVAEPRDRAAVAALARALRVEAHASGAVAAAAAGRRYAEYASRGSSLRSAGQAVREAALALRRMAFGTVPVLSLLELPALRRPRPPEPSVASPTPETSTTPTAPEAAPEVIPEAAPEPAPAPQPTPAPEHATVPAQPLR